MASKIEDVLDIETENELYRETLYVVKKEMHRIRTEYCQSKILDIKYVDELDEELETLALTIEKSLF